ncbi:hypothetical protein ACFQ14_11840 [Pseudahrensia aquimaris]|uniref:Uncharacterized protein n=1 Tax=Pseudahrensia aquimaris TaxID=744461 RepID=A0ABW3FF50_9HYPH
MDKDDLLLAHFQGRLTTDETKKFQALVENDADFAAEVAALSASRTVFASEQADGQTGGWNKLSSAIDADARKPANDNKPMRLSLLQTACVAAAAVVCWQFFASPLLTSQETPITMASPVAEGPTLQVVFADGASLAQVSAVLYELEGTIVNGPSAIGVYRVEFIDEKGREAARAALRQQPNLISEILSE